MRPKKFKGSTGLCFKEYLNYIRVQKASDMLRNTDLSVTGVAMACGFSDGNYFGDVFRRLTGVSPREYRKGQTVLNQGRVRFMSGSDTGISP